MVDPLSHPAPARNRDGRAGTGGGASSLPPAEADSNQRRARTAVWLIAVIAVILSAWALRAAEAVVVPVVAAIFIALVVAPVSHAVKRRVPRRLRRLGEAAAMGLVILALVAFFAGIFVSAQQVASRFGGLAEVAEMIPVGGARSEDADASAGQAESEPPAGGAGDAVRGAPDGAGTDAAVPRGRARAAEPFAEGEDAGNGDDLWQTLREKARALVGGSGGNLVRYASGYATTVLDSAGKLLAALTLIFFLVLLILIETPRWRGKAMSLIPDGEQSQWQDTLDVAARSFRWYLFVRTVLGAITATLYVGWLWLFGVDLLFVWWVLTFLLSYIPTIGSIISGLIPILYVLITKDFATTVFVALGILVIEQVMGNFIDPRMLGKQLSLSPFVTFAALVFWGWMWGVPGALLAVPLTVFFVIVGARVSALRPMALLLSDETSLDALAKRTRT